MSATPDRDQAHEKRIQETTLKKTESDPMTGEPESIFNIRKQSAEVKTDSAAVSAMTPELAREIRDLSHQSIARVSGSDLRPRESFVFREDHFCGIRYRLGLFHTQWMTDSIMIQIYRDGKPIGTAPVTSLQPAGALDPVVRRAA